MPGAPALELPKTFDVVEPDADLAKPLVAVVHRFDLRKVKHRIEEHRGMSYRENEPVPVGPDRIVRIKAQRVLPEFVDDRRQRHRRSGVSRIRLLNSVDAKGANGVDRQRLNRRKGRYVVHRVGLLQTVVWRKGDYFE